MGKRNNERERKLETERKLKRGERNIERVRVIYTG